MSNSSGKFVWYELMTTDPKAAESFYRSAVGWSAKDARMPGMSYTLFSAGETQVAGLMALPKEARDMGAGPGWIGYVGVDDVDASAVQVAREGGKVHRAPADIPGVGRFAIAADPQGAKFALFKPVTAEERQPAAPGTPGHGGWHELHTSDNSAAFSFYSKLFGWTKGEAMDMGPAGVYQIFAAGGPPAGGMMNESAGAPYWLYYFVVDAIDAAKTRVEKAGGQILSGPIEVPGGNWIVTGRDPQGAAFALVAPKR